MLRPLSTGDLVFLKTSGFSEWPSVRDLAFFVVGSFNEYILASINKLII